VEDLPALEHVFDQRLAQRRLADAVGPADAEDAAVPQRCSARRWGALGGAHLLGHDADPNLLCRCSDDLLMSIGCAERPLESPG
jgi:hypothetical protein